MLEINGLVNLTNIRGFEEILVRKLVMSELIFSSLASTLCEEHKLVGSDLKKGFMDFLFNQSVLSAVALQKKKLREKHTVACPEETCFSVVILVIEI